LQETAALRREHDLHAIIARKLGTFLKLIAISKRLTAPKIAAAIPQEFGCDEVKADVSYRQ